MKTAENTIEAISRIGKKATHEVENSCVADRFIHFLLSLNKKFNMPDENLILKNIFSSNQSDDANSTDITSFDNYKYLSEVLLNLVNFEGIYFRTNFYFIL